jgi:hypothetical protein
LFFDIEAANDWRQHWILTIHDAIAAMTITELRNIANGLANRASRVAAGPKQDSINRGWLAIERLYGYAKATLPKTAAGLSLKNEPETWVNIARLAGAIVAACDHAEPRAADEMPSDYRDDGGDRPAGENED